jgi:hypothetical protein
VQRRKRQLLLLQLQLPLLPLKLQLQLRMPLLLPLLLRKALPRLLLRLRLLSNSLDVDELDSGVITRVKGGLAAMSVRFVLTTMDGGNAENAGAVFSGLRMLPLPIFWMQHGHIHESSN